MAKTVDMDRSLAGPSDAIDQELENVDARIIQNVDGEVVDYGSKLPNVYEDRTADDQSVGTTSGKILSCEDTEIDTEMHDSGRVEKDPSLGDEEDNIDRLTAFDPKDSEDLTKNNEGKKDSMIHEIQENHSGHSMAVDEEKNKNKKDTDNVKREMVLKKFMDQNKWKLHIIPVLDLQSAGDDEGNQKYILIARIHPHREPMHVYFFAYIISIEYRQVFAMQGSDQVLAWIRSVQQKFSTDCLDMHDLTLSAISSPYSSCKRTFMHYEIEPNLSSRRTGHMSKCDISDDLMPYCSQTQSEQHALEEAVTTSNETSDINAACDLLSSREVTRMKNTRHDIMLTQKRRDTGQHTRTIKEISISSHICLYGNIKDKILQRQALKSPYWKEHSTLQEMLYIQSSYEKESLDAKKWYLEWGSDHPLFRYTNLHVNAVRFGAEGIPPRPHIQLPAPALPLTRFLEFNSGFNVPAARAEVTTEGPNFAASSAQEQCSNQSNEIKNTISFSSRAWVEEFPSITSADEGNGYCLECSSTLSLRPSNDDQKEAAALESTVLKWNVDTNNSGSEEKIPRVHSHPVEESAESEANNRPTFPNQTATFIHDWPPYLDHTSQQVAEVGSIFRDSLDRDIRDVAPICDNVGVAAASTPGIGEIEKYLMTDAAQSVLFMGYQQRVVLLAIRRVLMSRVAEEMSGQMIMEAVFEIEEEENQCPSTPSSELDQGNDMT